VGADAVPMDMMGADEKGRSAPVPKTRGREQPIGGASAAHRRRIGGASAAHRHPTEAEALRRSLIGHSE